MVQGRCDNLFDTFLNNFYFNFMKKMGQNGIRQEEVNEEAL
jgi:hypothetical protein